MLTGDEGRGILVCKSDDDVSRLRSCETDWPKRKTRISPVSLSLSSRLYVSSGTYSKRMQRDYRSAVGQRKEKKLEKTGYGKEKYELSIR